VLGLVVSLALCNLAREDDRSRVREILGGGEEYEWFGCECIEFIATFSELDAVAVCELIETVWIMAIPATKLRARGEVLAPLEVGGLLSKSAWPEAIDEDPVSVSRDRVPDAGEDDRVGLGGRPVLQVIEKRSKVLGESAELVEISCREALERAAPCGREGDAHRSRIARVGAPPNEAGSDGPIDELHRAVVAQEEVGGDVTDRWSGVLAVPPHGEQKLMLRRS
jgi:hypothetical protein